MFSKFKHQYAYRFGRQCFGLAEYEDCPYGDDPWRTWWRRGWKDAEREQSPRPAWMRIGKTVGAAIKRRGQSR